MSKYFPLKWTNLDSYCKIKLFGIEDKGNNKSLFTQCQKKKNQ